MNDLQFRTPFTVLLRLGTFATIVIFGILTLMSFLNNDYDNMGMFGGILFLVSGIITSSFLYSMAINIELKKMILQEVQQLNVKE
ncbi:hypothetical protein P4L29_22645 [Bacillus cereus]|nr:hypothetical protein [Bacillus cereus]